MTMIEKVARAICKERFDNGGVDDDGWDSATPDIQRDYLVQARAAIEAMREPTDEMLDRAHACCGDYRGASVEGRVDWNRAIAAALYEAPTAGTKAA